MDNYDLIELNNLIKDNCYLNSLYTLREEMVIGKVIRLLGSCRDSNFKVNITKQIINVNDMELVKRISVMCKLVEDNVILIENIWIEKSEESK